MPYGRLYSAGRPTAYRSSSGGYRGRRRFYLRRRAPFRSSRFSSSRRRFIRRR
jgi:hypothetical protein